MRFVQFLPHLNTVTTIATNRRTRAASVLLLLTAASDCIAQGVAGEFARGRKTSSERPKSTFYALSATVKTYALPQAQPFRAPKRFGAQSVGFNREIPAEAMADGGWSNTPSGERVWRLALRSPGAKGIRVHLTGFDAAGGRVWLYGDGAENYRGPYEGKGIFGDGEFWTGTVEGESAVIEYSPDDPLEQNVPFSIDQLAHLGTLSTRKEAALPRSASDPVTVLGPLAAAGSTRDAASCQLDVSCYSEWSQTSRGVVQIQFAVDQSWYVCTAFLVNTKAGSQEPYLLTNNHCVNDAAAARTVDVFWNYQTSACNGSAPGRPTPQGHGADYLAGSPAPDYSRSGVTAANLDFAFLRLRSTPPQGAYFLGWTTARGKAGTDVFAIGHPADNLGRDFKRIAFGRVLGGTAEAEFRFGSVNGLTEPGMSGSPWLSSPGVVIGLNASGNSTFFPNACSTGTVSQLRSYGPWFADIYPQISNWMEDGTTQTCSFDVSASNLTVAAAGGSGSIPVTTQTGCSWTSSSNAGWATVSGGVSGSGAVTWSVQPNPSSQQRTGTLTVAGRNITIVQAGTPQQPSIPVPGNGLRFVPMAPCRVMETRSEYNFQGRTGSFGPPFLIAGDTRTLQLAGFSGCSIPAAAQAFVLNVTLQPRGPVDHVTLWPAGEAKPNYWTARSLDGFTVANSAIVKAGGSGAIQVYSAGATDMIIDISGYFVNDASGLMYYAMTPCRAVDTRIAYRATGAFGAPAISGRQSRRFRLPASPYCSMPQGASAYSVTVTAIPSKSLSYLTAWPGSSPQPNVSTINSPQGRVVANSVIIPAGPDGSIDIFALDSTDLLIDVTGYFAPDDGVRGLLYHPVTQCRVSHTADVSYGWPWGPPSFSAESMRTLPLASSPHCPGIPKTAKAIALNVTAMPGGSPLPFVTVWPNGEAMPNVSQLNAFEGQVVANSAIVAAGVDAAVNVYAFRPANLAVEISGYFSR